MLNQNKRMKTKPKTSTHL